jgi:hypothetical protein
LAGEQVLAAALAPGEAVGVDLAEAVVEVEQVLVHLDLQTEQVLSFLKRETPHIG